MSAGWLGALLWTGGVGAFLVVNEVAARLVDGRQELFRKTAHIGIAAMVAASVLLGGLDHRWWAVIGALFAVLLVVARRLLPLRSFSGRAESLGEIVYGVGVALAAAAPDPRVFCCAVLMLGLADPAAMLVGRAAPLHRVAGGKSVGGCLAFVLVAAVLAVALLPASTSVPVAPLLVAVVGAAAELVSRRGLDNLTVPALVALVGSLVAG